MLVCQTKAFFENKAAISGWQTAWGESQIPLLLLPLISSTQIQGDSRRTFLFSKDILGAWNQPFLKIYHQTHKKEALNYLDQDY